MTGDDGVFSRIQPAVVLGGALVLHTQGAPTSAFRILLFIPFSSTKAPHLGIRNLKVAGLVCARASLVCVSYQLAVRG